MEKAKRRSIVDIFISKDKLTKFWFGMFLLSIFAFIFERNRIISQLNRKPQFIVMDGANTFYLASSIEFDRAVDIHTEISRLVVEALFDRGPKGPDHSERLKRILGRTAYSKALDMIGKEADIFRAQNIHQKVETGTVNVLQVASDQVLIRVSGQIIRNGIFENKPYLKVFDLEVFLKLALNKDMKSNGRFPLVSLDFEPKLKEKASS